jgi:hypothetical protein
MWQFEFEAPVKTRILRSRFFGIQHYCKDGMVDKWFAEVQKKWLERSNIDPSEGCSNTANCRSFKAFKRHLRKHPELQECFPVVLVSRFVGHSIIARWADTTPALQHKEGEG